MKSELLRRLSILENKKVPEVNARTMRGGMQKRLHRQEVIRFKNKINKQTMELKDKLVSLIEQETAETINSLGIFSTQSIDPLDNFNEPTLKRIRSKRGFF